MNCKAIVVSATGGPEVLVLSDQFKAMRVAATELLPKNGSHEP